MKPMTPTERIFLNLEQPGYPIDIVGIFLLAADPAGPLPFDHVRWRLLERTRTMPVFWRKVAHAPMGIGEDRWVSAAHFNIDDHLSRMTVPEPGDLRALLDLVLEITKEPLDRDKPLWDGVYVEGLADSRTALLLRSHHALVDGVGGMEINETLFDRHPMPVTEAVPDEPLRGAPEAGLLWRATREVPDRVTREAVASTRLVKAAWQALSEVRYQDGVKAAVNAVRRPQILLDAAGSRVRTIRNKEALPHLPRYIPSAVHHPPKTIFNRHVSEPAKSFAVIDLPFEEIAQVRAGVPGVTAGDVLLALVTGTLRDYLAAHDDLPDRALWTTCPVNVRSGGEAVGEGNNFTTMWIELPVHLEDPLQRLHAVHASAAAAKVSLERSQAGWEALANVGDLLLPGVVHAAMAFAGTPVFEFIPPTLNLTVSTMRGPAASRYFAGREIENFYGRMIICPPVHLFFHSVTYRGMVEFGITSVRQLVPDPDRLADGLRAELDRLLAVAPQHG